MRLSLDFPFAEHHFAWAEMLKQSNPADRRSRLHGLDPEMFETSLSLFQPSTLRRTHTGRGSFPGLKARFARHLELAAGACLRIGLSGNWPVRVWEMAVWELALCANRNSLAIVPILACLALAAL